MIFSFNDLMASSFGHRDNYKSRWYYIKLKIFLFFKGKQYSYRRQRILQREGVHRTKRLLKKEMLRHDTLFEHINCCGQWHGSIIEVPLDEGRK